MKADAGMLAALPLKVKSSSPPVGTRILSPKNSLVDRTNTTSCDPVQSMGGRMAPPTSQPKPVMCNTITGLLAV